LYDQEPRVTAKEGPPMADDERRDATAVLTPARATAMAHPITVSVRETWWNWFPNERIEDGITLDEFLDELAGAGIPQVTADRLASWQKIGVIPFPIRRWHNGATRALFPRRAISVIAELVLLQHSGSALQEISARLRGAAALTSYANPDELRDKLTDLADRHQERTGRRMASVEIRFTDVNGREEAHAYGVRFDHSGSDPTI